MSMPPGSPPPGPPYEPPGGGAVPPGYNPPGQNQPPPGGGYNPPGSYEQPGGSTPPGGGYGAPGPYQPPGGPVPSGGYGQPSYGGYGATPGPLAEWSQRALGGLIDYVGPAVVIYILFFATRSLAIFFVLWLLTLGWSLYNAYLNGTTGQSVGKKVVGLKVVGEQTGQVIGAGTGIVRWLIGVAIGIIPCLGALFQLVNLLFPLWDAKKQTLHDKAVKSVVITVPK